MSPARNSDISPEKNGKPVFMDRIDYDIIPDEVVGRVSRPLAVAGARCSHTTKESQVEPEERLRKLKYCLGIRGWNNNNL